MATLSAKAFRRAVREFNRFRNECPGIGESSPDPVQPGERVIKRLVFDRGARTYHEERAEPGEVTR